MKLFSFELKNEQKFPFQ